MRRVTNPPNPWRSHDVEWLGEPPSAELEVYEEQARSILSENQSPDLGFRYSINPYRGCFHACSYCYARPTHEYLDLGAGTDFDRHIVAKVNAPELLAHTFAKPSWRGDLLVFSGVTDCYQPLEAHYRLTRRLLETCLEYRNPVGILTKSALIRRDVELLGQLAQRARLTAFLSIPFARSDLARTVEPFAASPAARFAAIRALADAGVSVGVAIAPIIPGLNDDQIPEILERARECGASRAFKILLRLPGSVKDVFIERLHQDFPQRAQRVLNALHELRGDRLAGAGFGQRMAGEGPRWALLEQLFRVTCRRLGMRALTERDAHEEQLPTTFRRPLEQGELF